MTITPRDIQQKEFHDAFRGYSHEEVDAFLDSVAAAFDVIDKENASLTLKLKETQEELTSAKGSEDMLKRMLVTAQETADRAVAEARSKSQGIEQSAISRAAEIVQEGETSARAIVVSAAARERDAEEKVEESKRFRREYAARFRAFIESQLRVLDELHEVDPPSEVPRSKSVQEQVESAEVSETSDPESDLEEESSNEQSPAVPREVTLEARDQVQRQPVPVRIDHEGEESFWDRD